MTDIQVAILSRRPEAAQRAASFWPKPVVIVPDASKDEFGEISAPFISTPPKLGPNPPYQWVLDNLPAPTVVFVHDEFEGLWCLVGRRARLIEDPHALQRIVENSASICAGAGLTGFSFAAVGSDLRRFQPVDPCSMAGQLQPGLFGVCRPTDVVFDPDVKIHPVVDFSLSCLLTDRAVWIDQRFSVQHSSHQVPDGDVDAEKAEFEYLRRKWGKYFRIPEKAGGRMIQVERRQEIKS